MKCKHDGWDSGNVGPKPKPAEMMVLCPHQQICPVCGFGWGSLPCPCQQPLAPSLMHYSNDRYPVIEM